MSRTVARLCPAALGGLLLAASVQAEERFGRWSGPLEIGDTLATLTVELAAGDGEPATPVARLKGVDGFVRELTVESWDAVDDRIRFRLVGLGRPYQFEGRMSDGKIDGTLQRQPADIPSTDLYLLPIESDGAWRVGETHRLTDREGYDNQPSFTEAGKIVLYTSMRGDQTDIYAYDLVSDSSHRITDSAESEYSPTPLPDGGGFSTVRVEADGRQRLWAFDSDGSNARLLLPSIEPVGYHAWLSPASVALFVLGEPNTLQIVDLESGESVVYDENIGRGLRRVPGTADVTYVRKDSEDVWSLRRVAAASGASTRLIETVKGSEDFAWTPDGELVMGAGTALYAADLESGEWRHVADLASRGISGVSRVAIGPDGRALVVVGSRPDLTTLPERLSLTLSEEP